uniref:NAD-dependent epimerase/dehydratase domain-containing protein n=1 Tax=Ananas comosus var. bracteatus TaxID=296719 RepID=A0A6V7QUN0_ANACO
MHVVLQQPRAVARDREARSSHAVVVLGDHREGHSDAEHAELAVVLRWGSGATAEKIIIWGSGAPLRDFLHVDDLADALVFLMDGYSDLDHVNVGSGAEIAIRDLAKMVRDVVGFQGEIVWDPTKPTRPRRRGVCRGVEAEQVGRGWGGGGWSSTRPRQRGVRGEVEAERVGRGRGGGEAYAEGLRRSGW